MNKLIKNTDETIIDFIINYGGRPEQTLLPFMVEQHYTCFKDFYNADKYILTNLLQDKRVNNIGSRTNTDFTHKPVAFDESFDTSFNA